MRGKFDLKRALLWVYALIILILTVLFFTNDFGLVDIRKTSVVVGAGIDVTGNGVRVTAQLAVPQPSESGENTQYTEIEGEGVTVADALREINVKTGFYPKLLFCKLIVLGDSCKEVNIFEVLDYFYRNEYTQLTPLVAMCEGQAGELLGAKMPIGDNATASLERILSDEAKKSGSVSTVNLKEIGESQHSAAASCYMPYVVNMPQGGGQGGSSEGASGGSENGGNSSGGSQSGGGATGQNDGDAQFVCNTTAVFRDGMFAGILTEEQSFALNLLTTEIRHAFVPCSVNGSNYTIGMRGCGGGTDLEIEEGEPRLTVSFCASAQIQDVDRPSTPSETANSGKLSDEVLKGCENALKERFGSLIRALQSADCDALGIRNTLMKKHYGSYEKWKDDLLSALQVEYKIKIKSVN